MKPSYLISGLALLASTPAAVAAPADDSPVAFNGVSYPLFPAKVQPVLMNLCARCHCQPDHSSGFQLARVREGYADAQASGRNVRAAVRFVTPDDPAGSPLLVKAVTAHGGQKDPSLPSRAHPAFKNLEYWAAWAVSPEGSPTPVPPARPVVVQAAARFPDPPPATVAPMTVSKPADPPPMPTSPEPARLPASVTAKPSATPNPHDPFDPTVFNGLK